MTSVRVYFIHLCCKWGSQTEEVCEGVLKGGATFDSLQLPADKVLFKFTKRERVQQRGPKKYENVEVLRPVFADALSRLAAHA